MTHARTRTVLVDGHSPRPTELREPVWSGTLADFFESNATGWRERYDIVMDLERQGWHRIGGAAAAAFTLYTAEVHAALLAASPGETSPDVGA